MNIPIKKRILLVAAAFAIQLVYTPTSLFMKGGIEPKIAWDVFPLQVIWLVPYVLCYPLWIFSIAWAVWKIDDQRFRSVIAACVLTFSIGSITYLLFPTYVVHPVIPGNDILGKTLIFLQTAGGDHDAFPSAHIYMTVLVALFYSQWYPKQKWLWIVIVILVSLSTLYTKQHYILDVIGGIAAAWIGYRFGLWWIRIDLKQRRVANARN